MLLTAALAVAASPVAAAGEAAPKAGATLTPEGPVAPVAAIRASRSAAVVHVMLVPGEFTNGSEAHLERRKCQLTRIARKVGVLTRARCHKAEGQNFR